MTDDLAPIIRAARKKPVYVPAPDHALALARVDIERLIPHRPPFLFVDAITAFDRETGAIAGTFEIAKDDPLFVGHFPGDPIYPGVLQLEAIGQLALCALGLQSDRPSTMVRALAVHHAGFFAPVRPGDRTTVLATVLDSVDITARCLGQLWRGDTVCCSAILEVYLGES